MASLLDLASNAQNFFTNAGNNLSRGFQTFGYPQTQAVDKWINSPQQFQVPNYQVPQQVSSIPVIGGAAQTAANVGTGLLNFGLGAPINIGTDIGRTIVNPLGNQQYKSGLFKVGQDIGNTALGYNQLFHNQPVTYNPGLQKTLGDVGQLGTEALTFAGGRSANIFNTGQTAPLWQRALAAAGNAAPTWYAYGAGQGLSQNQDKPLVQQLQNANITGLQNAAVAAAFAGATPIAGAAIKGLKGNPLVNNQNGLVQIPGFIVKAGKLVNNEVGGINSDFRNNILTPDNLQRNLKYLDEQGITPNKDGSITLYRGQTAGTKSVAGDNIQPQAFFTTDPALAKRFGKVSTVNIDPNDLVVNGKMGDGITFQNLGALVKDSSGVYRMATDLVDNQKGGINLGAKVSNPLDILDTKNRVTDAQLQGVGSETPLNEKIQSEAFSGWLPGQKSAFDQALAMGDAEKVRNMLPGVPKDYQVQFADKITQALSGKGILSQINNQRGGINLSAKVENPIEGVTTAKADVAKILNGAPTKQKAIVTRLQNSDRYTPDMRKMLQGTYVPISNKETIATAKNLIRLDPKAAEARALNPQNAADQAIGSELFNYHMDRGDVAKANEILNKTAGTNEGQMIQILSQYDKTSPTGAVKFAQNAVSNYNKAHPTAKLDVSDAQLQDFYNAAKKIQSMPEGRDRNIAGNDLLNKINALIPSSFADKVVTVWKAALLTSLRTHERNILGNTIHGLAETAKDIPASITDSLLSLKTGQRTLTPTIRGVGSGTITGLKQAKDIVKMGYDPEQAISKYDVQKINWGNNPVEQGLKRFTDTVFRTLGAEDKPFYSAAFARSLYDQAGAEAINAGKSGDGAFIENTVKNPTTQMLQNATHDAEVASFHNQTGLSKIARAIQEAKVFNVPVGQVIAPFTGVPSSIAQQMIEYSPAGLIKGAVHAGQVLASDVPTLQRQASQEIGRGVLGTGLFGVGAYLMNQGLLTGQPKDVQEAQQWQLEGKPSNSVLVGGQWRAIGSIGPENLVLLAGAKAQEELNKGADASLGNFGANIGKDFAGQTFLQGISGPINAIADPYRYGPSYLGNTIASAIPNIVKDAAKSTDPYQRENNTISDYVTNSIPGLRQQGVVKRDNLGNILPQEPTGAGAFVDLFNSKTPVSNPIVDELNRLNGVGQNATPSKLGKGQTINGVKMTLTPQQLDTLESQVGPVLNQQLSNLFQDPAYQNLGDEEKAKAIDNIVSTVRKQVRGNIDLNSKSIVNLSDLKNSSPSGSTGGVYTMIDPNTGSVKTIDISKPIPKPISSGSDILDKLATSKYNTAITGRINNIYTLYQAGKISQTDAAQMIEQLTPQKISAQKAPKAKKSVAIKVSTSKLPTLKLSRAKAPTFKLSKTPTRLTKPVKLAAYKPTKFRNSLNSGRVLV